MKTEPKNGIYVPTIDIKEELVNLYLDVIEKDPISMLVSNKEEILLEVDDIFRLLEQNQALAFAYFRDDKLIGFIQSICGTHVKQKHTVHSMRTMISPAYQNSAGYGIKLIKRMQQALIELNKMYITTLTIKYSDMAERLGFKVISILEDYYILPKSINTNDNAKVSLCRWDNPNYKSN